VGIYKGKVHCSVNIGGLDKVREANQQEDKYPSFKDPIYQGENLRMLKKLSWYGNMVAKFKFGVLFGDAALLNDSPRSATVLTLEDCEFMVFHKRSLDAIKMSCNKDFEGRKKFLLEMIPEMAFIKNQLRVAQLIQYFKPARYKLGAFLTHEGDNSMRIFFMEEGEVTYLRNIPVPEILNGRKVKYRDKLTPISNIQGHAIIGEECIDSDPRYRYSVQVKSAEVKVLVLEKTSNFEDFQAFPLFPILLRDYKTKEKTRQAIFANIQISRIEKALKHRHLSTKNLPQSEILQLELAAVNSKPAEENFANKVFEFRGFDREENARMTGMIMRFGGFDKKILNPKIVNEMTASPESFLAGPYAGE
jgi:CRP-like cAMP-binding protein